MITTIRSSRGSSSGSTDSRADRILPGIQVGCMMHGVWGMHMGNDGENGDNKKQYGEEERGTGYDNRDRERYLCI